MQVDVGSLLNSPDEIARHGVREPLRANEHVHDARRSGEEHRGLSRRIAASYDDDLIASTSSRLGGGGGVIDSHAEISRGILEIQLTIFHTAGKHDAAALDRGAGCELDRIRSAFAPEAHRRGSRGNLRTELLRLHECAPRQRKSRDARRKAETILDLRARSRLASGRADFE